MFNILVVDDHAHIRRLYEVTLEQNGYKPYTACNGREALQLLETTHIDLIVLDVMMPEMDGYTFLRTLRDSGSEIPVLIITARDGAEDVRKAFTLGTDDFMVKPVDEIEMLLRIKALMRRAKISEEKKLTIGDTMLEYDSLSVTSGNEVLTLPKKEFQILFKLLSFPGKTFTRANIMDEFWEMDSDSEIRTVDVHINRLRERFRENTDFEIVTVRGLGYKAIHKKKN
ncbi:MAG: response regulator transcription factor [Ruminococcaceae bacterium]|nr:response regulator transcription factor [Oscillospiraceae bacterium]